MRGEFQRLASDKNFTSGYKAYYPISASPAMSQIIGMGTQVLPELLTWMESSSDPQFRKALLFILAHVDDPKGEETLILAMNDYDLNGLAAYLLGNYRYRSSSGEYNKPENFIRDKDKVLKSLLPFLKNTHEYLIHADGFEVKPHVGDLAIASFIRIGGLNNFNIDQSKYRWIGWEILEFTDEERKDLINAIEIYMLSG
ncbi:MAG: HEAT repeat domain-containing protein [Candidatus Methanoperedens sp.]|nr:HEAT repeat domain-containing protein [Candidatus Methanoperedens sp.]